MARQALIILLLLASAGSLQSQSLASRVGAVRDGDVRFSFASRPEVCGDGERNIDMGHNHRYMNDSDGRYGPCEYGPVRVTLEMHGGQVMKLRTAVAGRPRSEATDLGQVGTGVAVDYLFSLARSLHGHAGEEVNFPDHPGRQRHSVARDVPRRA